MRPRYRHGAWEARLQRVPHAIVEYLIHAAEHEELLRSRARKTKDDLAALVAVRIRRIVEFVKAARRDEDAGNPVRLLI
jgi:hypothetical protein